MIDRVWLWWLPWLQFSRKCLSELGESRLLVILGWLLECHNWISAALSVTKNPKFNPCFLCCEQKNIQKHPKHPDSELLMCDYQVSLPPWYCSTVSGKSRVLMGRTSSCDRTKTPEMLREKFMSVDSLWLIHLEMMQEFKTWCEIRVEQYPL